MGSLSSTRGVTIAFIPTVVFAFFSIIAPAFAQTTNLVEKARQSIVFVFFDVIDPRTGAKSAIQGTGFVVSKDGYMLTASHLFRTWRTQSDVDRDSNPVKGTLRDKPGSVIESPLNLQIVNTGNPDAEDVALLKLPDPGEREYPRARICFSKTPKVGDDLMAFGFPLGQNFQPVHATLGTQNAPGGRWAAASPFTYGMSGGPVYSSEGFVIGIVKGGLDDAVKWITPIRHAENFLGQSAGRSCSTEQSIRLRLSAEVPRIIQKQYHIADGQVQSLDGNFTQTESFAVDGFEFTDVNFDEAICNKCAHSAPYVSEDRSKLNFRYTLSGAAGYLEGSLNATMRQKKPEETMFDLTTSLSFTEGLVQRFTIPPQIPPDVKLGPISIVDAAGTELGHVQLPGSATINNGEYQIQFVKEGNTIVVKKID